MATDELETRLAALAAPLQEERATIERAIQERSAELAKLRADASRLDQILRRLNGTPSPAGRKKKTPHGALRPGLTRPSAASMEKVVSVLREWEGRERFTAPELQEALAGIVSHDTTHRAVLALHEDGQVQLLGRDGGPVGNARVYRYLGT